MCRFMTTAGKSVLWSMMWLSILGIASPVLYQKMKRLGIKQEF